MVSARVKRGGTLQADVWIENVGVAPLYRPYAFLLKLSQGQRVHLHRSEADVRTWRPGDAWLQEECVVPDDLQPGTATLHAALVDSEDESRKVRFANEGVEADGWLPFGTVEVI